MRTLIVAVGLAVCLGASVGAQPPAPGPGGPTVAQVQGHVGVPAVPQGVDAWFRQNTGFTVEDFFKSSLWALTPQQRDDLTVVMRDVARQFADSSSPQACLNAAWPRVWDILNDEQRDRVALFVEARDRLASGDFSDSQEQMARGFSDMAIRVFGQLKGQMGQQDPLVSEIFESILRRFQAVRP